MKKIIYIALITLLLTGCGKKSYKTITAEEAKEMMKGDVVVLDVRTKEEYEKTHIENAINIPLNEITENNENLPKKEETILVYCQSGNRSKEAASKLAKMGYKNVYNFGGISNWNYEKVEANNMVENLIYTLMDSIRLEYLASQLEEEPIELPLVITCNREDGQASCTYGKDRFLNLKSLPTSGTIVFTKEEKFMTTSDLVMSGYHCSISEEEIVDCKK